MLKLAEGEYVTRVSGRAGNLIDHLKIETNLGNSVAAGQSTGGNPFAFGSSG